MSTNTADAARLAARLKTLETLDALLPTLSGVLDIREVFHRVAEIAQQVLPHDGVVIGELVGNNQRVRMYATQGVSDGAAIEVPVLDSRLVTEAWEWRLVDDLLEQPQYADSTIAKFGMRGALFVPVRVDGKMFGGVAFYSKQRSRFTTDDVLPAKRIADHVALALSHKRLADETRRNQALRDRAAKSDLLDDLLATVTDVSELPVVFERISKASQNVLAHDALVLTAVLPGGTDARVYASQAPGAAAFPEIVKVPPLMRRNPDWEYDLVEDLQKQDDQKNLDATRLGYRAALRIAIRLDGEYAAGLSFLSMTPATYSAGDVPFARRIADQLASFHRAFSRWTGLTPLTFREQQRLPRR